MKKSSPENLTQIAAYLKHSDLRQRQGILDGKRVDFFKGKHAVNALLRPGYSSSSAGKKYPIGDRESAENIIKDLHQSGFFLKAEKPPKSRFLKLIPDQDFQNEAYYFWVYQGSQWRGYLLGFGIVAVIFAGVMFPLWPALPRQGVYYLSLLLLAFIGFIMGLGVIRAILWLVLKLSIGRGGWLFPNLFADVGFFESFVPFWAWDPKKKGAKKIKKSDDSDMDNDQD